MLSDSSILWPILLLGIMPLFLLVCFALLILRLINKPAESLAECAKIQEFGDAVETFKRFCKEEMLADWKRLCTFFRKR